MDNVYNQTINVLKMASKSMQVHTNKAKKPVVPGWNEYCKESHECAWEAFLCGWLMGRLNMVLYSIL
jgi:hypothetical protein